MSFHVGNKECQVERSLRCHNFWVIVGGDAEKGFLICIIIVVSALPHILSPEHERWTSFYGRRRTNICRSGRWWCCLTFGLSPDFTTSDGNLKKKKSAMFTRADRDIRRNVQSTASERGFVSEVAGCPWAVSVINSTQSDSVTQGTPRNETESLNFPHRWV